jgi:homoserine kinase type II
MEKLIKKLVEIYPLKITKSFGKVAGGYLSDNFAVGNENKKYFLRQYRAKYTRPEIEAIHRVKKFFAENDIPIISPLKTNNGETFFGFEDRFYALFPFVEEKNIRAKDLSLKSIKSIAKILAKIHLLSKDGFPNITDDRRSTFDKEKCLCLGEKLLEIVKKKKKKDEFDNKAIEVIKFKLNLIKSNAITSDSLSLSFSHLIHGDFHELNLFYDKEGEVKYVYDLEKATVAPRAYEIARALDFICLTDFKDKNFEKARKFIKAYRLIYPITDGEFRKGYLFYEMKRIHNFWIEEAHYLDNNKRTDVFYLPNYKKLIYYSKNLDKVADKILKEK